VVPIMLGELQSVDAMMGLASAAAAASFEDKDGVSAISVSQKDVTMKLIYVGSIVSMGILVIGLYRRRPTAVIIRIMLYLLALSTIKMSVRILFVEHHFDFPKFLTGLHFFTSGLFCCIILMCTSLAVDKRDTIPSWRCMIGMILPISVAFACSIAAGNAALVYASTSFVEMISTSTPVCTVIVAILFDQPFRKQLVLPVLVVCGGLALCVTGQMKFSTMGCIFSLLATLLRSVKAVLQQILMVGENSKFGPFELLAWISVPSVVLMLSWSMATEGLEPYSMLAKPSSYHLILSISLTCVNACILNVMGTFVVKDLGAVGAQLTGQLKGVLTVLGGMAMLHETVYPQQAIGYGLVLLGVFWYTNMEASLKAQDLNKADQTSHEGSPLLQNSLQEPASQQQISRSRDIT